MTNKRNTKQALIASAILLSMTFTMLLGTTFAWFTDSATSSGNIIKAGTLDVAFYWANGEADVPGDNGWTNAEGTATEPADPIFYYENWEPGYVAARHLKVANEGSLALKFQLLIVGSYSATATEEIAKKLASVIDVYYFADAKKLTRADLAGVTPVGTLEELMYDPDGAAYGVLDPHTEDTLTIAFKMREEAGNEFQGLSIGSFFDLKLLATQYNKESDSFGTDYDADLPYPDDEGNIHMTLDDGSEIVYTDDGDIALYSLENVTASDEPYYVPDGVKSIGDYAFSTNSDIAEVVLPTSVTSLGRGFDSSNVKKVVLNEGLETIDSRAFRSTTALEEVVIPSTVKTIADNAFQKSAIKTITIPASVETIGEAAFGASKIETVIFEGNTAIQGYAFRGCPNLRTVYLYGDDVTFVPSTLNGRNSMWFCNGESNNPNTSDIDFHVVNDTVKERVLVAMGAERNNTDVYIDIDVVSNDAELLAAVTNANDKTATILLNDGTYSGNLDLTVAALGQATCENIVFKANGDDVVIAGTVTIGYRQQNVGAASYEAKITFDGITFDHAEVGKHSLNVQDVESFHMVNCTVIGDGEYGLSTPGSNGTGAAKIENCTFINAGLQISGKFAQTVVIDGCTFEESVINVQGGGPLGPTIQNSTFDITLKESHNNESFYVVRNSNAGANINVKNCEINVDAEEGFVGVAGSKGWGVFVNRIASYDINAENVAITMTDAALAQPALEVAKCLSTGEINMTNVTVNGNPYKVVVYDSSNGNLFDAIAGLTAGDTLIIPEGTYNTSGTFQVPAGVTIKGESGKNIVIHQNSSAQDDIFNCAGDATIANITFESNRKGYAIAGNVKAHDGDGNITVVNCNFKGIATEKNYGIYKNLNGNLVVVGCTFDNYNNALCGISNGSDSTTTITGCTFTNINGEAVGYVLSTMPADFEAEVINNNTGLTEDNVIGY